MNEMPTHTPGSGKDQESGPNIVSRCEWARQETLYLEFQLGNGKVKPQVDKVEAVCNCPRPCTNKEVHAFLGLVGLVPGIHTALHQYSHTLDKTNRQDGQEHSELDGRL